jgi:ergosteryl-3beta-O-L-aspartate synthase
MSVIRRLSNAIHHLPSGDGRSSADSSRASSPRRSPSKPFSSFSPRRSIVAALRDKDILSSNDEFSDEFSDPDYAGQKSKNAQKRQAKKQQREPRSRHSLEQRQECEKILKNKLEEASKHETQEMSNCYGDLPLVQSSERSGESRIKIENITADMVGQEIVFRARLHHVRRMGLKLVFFVFRQQLNSMQGVLNEVPGFTSIVMLHWAEHIPRGSIVRVKGMLQKPEVPVKSTSMHEMEVKVIEMKLIVCRAEPGMSTCSSEWRSYF